MAAQSQWIQGCFQPLTGLSWPQPRCKSCRPPPLVWPLSEHSYWFYLCWHLHYNLFFNIIFSVVWAGREQTLGWAVRKVSSSGREHWEKSWAGYKEGLGIAQGFWGDGQCGARMRFQDKEEGAWCKDTCEQLKEDVCGWGHSGGVGSHSRRPGGVGRVQPGDALRVLFWGLVLPTPSC